MLCVFWAYRREKRDADAGKRLAGTLAALHADKLCKRILGVAVSGPKSWAASRTGEGAKEADQKARPLEGQYSCDYK